MNISLTTRNASSIPKRKRIPTPYGKPAMIYTHNGGVEGIAMDLYKMLSEDLSVRLDLERYNGIKGERQEARQEMRQNIAVQTEGIETKEKIPLRLRKNGRR